MDLESVAGCSWSTHSTKADDNASKHNVACDPDMVDEFPVYSGDHQNKLKQFCRICGKPKALCSFGPPISVSTFSQKLLKVYELDISNDVVEIHPPFMCGSCKRSMDKAWQKVKRRKMYQRSSTLATFIRHGENCEICEFQLRRSPRKTPSKHHITSAVKSLEQHGRDGGSVSTGSQQGEIVSQGLVSEQQSSGKEHTQTVARKSLDFSRERGAVHVTSIQVERCVEESLGDRLKCNICLCVPMDPIITECGHIHCRICMENWLSKSNACTYCKTVIGDMSDVVCLQGFQESVYKVLHVTCKYAGCKQYPLIGDIISHESSCKYGKFKSVVLKGKSNRVRGPSVVKKSLNDSQRQYVKKKRLRPLIDNIDEFCDTHHESRRDVLFFLLRNELEVEGNKKGAKAVENIWLSGDGDGTLTPDECLALRVDTLQSKTQYRNQYEILKSKGDTMFHTPDKLNKTESLFMPGAVIYRLFDGHEDIRLEHNASQMVGPIDILESFDTLFPETPTPNLKGVRWNYSEALAKTLEELDPEVVDGITLANLDAKDLVLEAIVKDGGDGMGECSVYKERGDRFLPDKALRFSFCVVSVRAHIGNVSHNIYQCSNPNSVRTNRPLLEAIADENDKAAATVCIAPLEFERAALKGIIIEVNIDNETKRKYKITFLSSMEDEKYDRAFGGLQGSGSSHLCTLCTANAEEAKRDCGSFTINRSLEQTTSLSLYVRANPDNLSPAQLNNVAKGVKAIPILKSEPIERMLDATHADINMANFFKKLLVRLIAGLCQWELTKDVKDKADNAEVLFDNHIKRLIGSNPQLMMPGNYARMLFSSDNENIVTMLIPDSDARGKVRDLLSLFRQMREVYRSNKPDPVKVSGYKTVAVSFALSLKTNFPFARWPNYLHKLVEHVQELIEWKDGPGSIGAMSSEGNEAGNKIFRHIRKNLASRGNTYNGLVDVLRLHWLYSSPELVRLAKVSHSKVKCGLCGDMGHNRATCVKHT